MLYVDDEEHNRIVFEQSLMAEFAIRVAPDAEAALRIMDEYDVAVIMSDIRMPGMSGDDLLSIVAQRHPRTVRMVLTAFSDIDPILRAINQGLVARYMIKPWNRDEMIQTLRWGVETWNFGRDAAELQRRLIETERWATMGRFSAMFIHDVRTPVGTAMTNNDMISLDYLPHLRIALDEAGIDPAHRQKIDEMIDDIKGAQEHVGIALQMAKDFLGAMSDFGKPQKTDGPPPEADPLPVIRHAITVCHSIAVAKKAQLGFRLPSELPHVRISAVSLTQVLVNLLNNGVQAVAARGLENGEVSVVARVRPDELELRVHDQGVGMPPEILNRIGTPFFTTKNEGSGLGLAQCQRLIGGAGGRLKIESELGVGTTVTIILPTAA